ncbi:MAG: NADPH:quinone oxidoreductase family protein [Rhodospirillales bacterium]|nr:NADPH:quinone oxidoreductase family protein [Rhodospirillales bacterium]
MSGQKLGIDGLKIEEAFIADPGDNQILIDVQAAALNFSDLLMIEDTYQVRPPRPFTPGQEVAGVVIDAPAASPWKTGDRIASKVDWGGFAEQALVRADMAIRIPDAVDLAIGAALPVVYTTAMVALGECVVVTPNDRVLVHAAAGGIGLAAVEIAKALGADVIATAGTKAKLDLARQHGADVLIDYATDDWVSAVMDATKGKGANLIVDPVGGRIGELSLKCIARDGTLLIVGFASGQIPRLEAHRLLLKRAAARGVYWNHDQDGAMLQRVNGRLSEMLDAGRINPLVDRQFGFDDLPAALQALQSRRTVGKVVLQVGAK